MKLLNISGVAVSVLALTIVGGCTYNAGHGNDEMMKDGDHGEMNMAADDHDEEAAFGQPGMAAMVTKTVDISIEDNAFSVGMLNLKEGDTVRFSVKNLGNIQLLLAILALNLNIMNIYFTRHGCDFLSVGFADRQRC